MAASWPTRFAPGALPLGALARIRGSPGLRRLQGRDRCIDCRGYMGGLYGLLYNYRPLALAILGPPCVALQPVRTDPHSCGHTCSAQ
jgi:hypothetical protein